VTALLIYDYFITFEDEVAELHDNNDAEMNLTISYRSVTHGRRRIFSVRKPLHFLWSAPTNDVLVFALFMFVSALHH